MKGPRSIAESVNSTHCGRFSTSASISAFSLDKSYAGLKTDKSLIDSRENMQSSLAYGHPSARDMAEKYKRLCTPPPDSDSPDGIRRSRTGRDRQGVPSRKGINPETMGRRDKNRSPLRQSIKNLLSAIKKGTTKSGEVLGGTKAVYGHDGGADSGSPPMIPEKDGSTLTRSHGRYISSYAPDGGPSQEQRMRSLPIHTSGTSDYESLVEFSGPIWHLSLVPAAPATWNLCTGVIRDRRLSVTSFIHNVAHRVLEVDLTRCTDVRPVMNSELNEDELASLSADDYIRELKVLELTVQNRERQKLAVRNLGERAAWISAIWDSIIPTIRKCSISSREELIRRFTQRSEDVVSTDGYTPTNQAVGPRDISSKATQRRERSLPPLPPQTPKMLPPLTIPPTSFISKVDIMPRIDSARTPSPSLYSFGSPVQSGKRAPAPSPSVTNLARRSMVKQRLAEMESPCLKRTSNVASPVSPTGTGRSGFLSALTSEDEPELNAIDPEHIPFGHLRESQFIRSVGAVESSERPAFARAESGCSELPYANEEAQENDLTAITNQLGGVVEQPTLREVLYSIDDCSQSTKRTVEELVKKFESLNDNHTSSPTRRREISPNGALTPPPHCSETREVLETTRTELFKRMDTLMVRLEELSCGFRVEAASLTTQADHGATKEDLAETLTTQLASLRQEVSRLANPTTNISDELSKISASINNDHAQRALQVQQQADSVRYLNELNSWLENFVRNGTAQISGLAANVEQLCRGLGSSYDLLGGSALHDIHVILSELRNRTDTSFLQQSVERLSDAVDANTQNSTNIHTLVNFMERQRQDQETFLRAFTAEISGEIKGERLRFVEAMKEATAINVQMQVDSLRKELTQEVATVARDLSRLESEKRAVETKIANLHAFHANQKQNLGQPAPLTVTANRPTYRPLARQPQYPAYAAYQQGRPLPYPRKS